MNKFCVTSFDYNVLGERLEVVLCEYDGKTEFKQPHFQRCWNEKLFDSEYDALVELRKLYPDRTLTVLEDTGKILSTYSYESGLTSMKIQVVINE